MVSTHLVSWPKVQVQRSEHRKYEGSRKEIMFEIYRKRIWYMENSISIQSVNFEAEDLIHMVARSTWKFRIAKNISSDDDEVYTIINIVYFCWNTLKQN